MKNFHVDKCSYLMLFLVAACCVAALNQENVYSSAVRQMGLCCWKEQESLVTQGGLPVQTQEGASQGASEKSGILWTWEGLSDLHWVWCNGKGSHLELRQEPKGSSPFKTPTTGSLKSWDR